MVEGRTKWTDDRLTDVLEPLRPIPVAVAELKLETKQLREALEVNSELQRERNRILMGFLGTLVLGLLAAVVTLVVSL